MIKSTHKPGRQRDWETKLFGQISAAPESIWRNILNPNSLRLTAGSYKQLRARKEVVFYQFAIDSISNLQLLQLDHLLRSPYYVRDRKHLQLLGEEDAIMLQLHGNNLKQYLENLANE